ncbi:DEAD/DEAH box helicase family protein [Metamycoplasma equirhinis]|uniref:DEAD/DEAH box helicase family protein n=1 Tax=Metamycoplasma equirhinis TaxID=92402 RepID=A0ABZ0PB79_9BACT|nr:DEAD/DEAH box helicase family protein [Metamycoplasma equirhinis]TPD97761.1 DEAD/DEAH box helicase [Metamycoplasma equirhinis]WPB54155.1 DEAD/DEAH box helicase family protein [Metamycoplasma equirhinis]
MNKPNLSKLIFKKSYEKNSDNFVDEFYSDCLKNSILYKRIAGYFNSSIFNLIKPELEIFIKNQGKIRIICNTEIIKNKEDLASIEKGYSDREKTLFNEEIVKMIRNNIESSKLLYLLIKQNILDIQIIETWDSKNKIQRFLHSKIGIFKDNYNNIVAFTGSHNETFSGWSEKGNEESFEVFCSWNTNEDERCDNKEKYFDSLWKNNEDDQNVILYQPSELLAILEKSIYEIDKEIDISRIEIYEQLQKAIFELSNKLIKNTINKWDLENSSKKLRPYQLQILENWEANNRIGLFNMCTGSGKTFTSICAIKDAIYNKNEIPLILVPSKLLEFQWKNEIKKALGNQILVFTNDDLSKYPNTLSFSKRQDENNKMAFIFTYKKASSLDFLKNFHWGKHIFLIADEVHNIGATNARRIMEYEVGAKIGLSATPMRKYDEEGSQIILSYFEKTIEPVYEISNGINDGALSRYNYFFNNVYLNEAESEEYISLTKRIGRKIALLNSKEKIMDDSSLQTLLINRAKILKKAEQKYEKTIEILNNEIKNIQDEKWLIYFEDKIEIKNFRQLLKQRNFKYMDYTYDFYSGMQNQNEIKNKIIEHFRKNGGIIFCIKCLDEGVDIPEINKAIIIASSKNPREYVQRRGRILRKHTGKNYAYIYDFLVLPSANITNDIVDSSLESEIERLEAFSRNSENGNILDKDIQWIKRRYLNIQKGEK